MVCRIPQAHVLTRQVLLITTMLACAAPRATTVTPSAVTAVWCQAPVARPSASDSLTWAALPDLENCVAPDGYREVRVITWYSLVFPSSLLRVVESEGMTTGAVHLVYPAGPDYTERVRKLYPTCVPAADEPEYLDAGRCRVELQHSPGWSAIMKMFDREDVWTLPDQGADSHPEDRILDGGGVAVEVRRGMHYRRYAYNNPDTITFPSHARIARVAAAKREALRQALSPR